MAKFFNARDINFIKLISEEVVDYVVEQAVTLFKMSVGESRTNLYGESLGKVYRQPANLMCIVDREVKNYQYEDFGPDATQLAEFRFNRQRLRTHEVPQIRSINGNEIPADSIQNTKYGYPEIGDILEFNNDHWEIDKINESRFIHGTPSVWDPISKTWDDARMQLVAVAHLVRSSTVQIEDRIH